MDKRELVFIAGSTTASLTVIGATKSDFYKFETVAIDVDVDAVQPCDAGTAQVTLSKQTASTTCPSNKFDLTSLVVGQLPPNIEVMWFTNPNHTWIKYLTPQTAAPNTYYAFYYDKVNNCYNTDNSIATVTVTGKICEPCSAGGLPVTLSNNKIKNICPATLVDLKPLVTNVAPPGSVIVFYSTPNHAPGTMIPEIQMTGKIYVYTSGTYYAFFYDQINDCFNTDNSIAAVDVTITPCPVPCNAGVKQVVLNTGKMSTGCPAQKVDLNKSLGGNIPDGTSLVWFKNPNHSGGDPGFDSHQAEAGTYYAFFYDAVNDCYNTNDSKAILNVTNVICPPCNATGNPLVKNTLSNTCPQTTVALDNALTGVNYPPLAQVVWFDNPNHSGNPYPTPQTAGPGDYYAFFYDLPNDCYNTDTSSAKVTVTINPCVQECKAGTDQVVVVGGAGTLYCYQPLHNLADNLWPSLTDEQKSMVVWYDNPNHAGNPIADPTQVGIGTYYAFYFDEENDCYNTDNSSAIIFLTLEGQVQLMANNLTASCPEQTVNLNNALGPDPLTEHLVWFTNPTHTGNPVADPTQAPANTYYAFYHYVGIFYGNNVDCWNTDNSSAQVIVTTNNPCVQECKAGTDQVVISGGAGTLYCYKPLHNLVNNVWPGLSDEQKGMVVWYDNPTHSGNPIADPTQVGIGTYYAFYFDEQNDCYNTDNSSAIVVLSLEGQVQLTANNLTASCPEQTVNLNNALGPDPLTEHLVWFTNPTHTGNPVADPTQAPANTYYAFYHYVGIFDGNSVDCWNTDNSSAQVIVTTNVCADMVQLSVKVNLQGAMHANLPQMRNDLQIYDGVGLLPQTDPYGGGKTVPGINNLAAAGTVVDWIKVEVRSAANPANILESQSLILRPNGDITNADLTVPKFSPQAEPVRIVIKHRNHVAIMSNSIATFGVGPVSYDFTTALAQAYNDGSASDQMKLVNGVWCMINGDPNQNLAVENQDINQTRNSFNQGILDVYSTRDLNMNGVLENLDMNIQRNRFNGNCFSILINY
ncbi:hypothetical protein [Dyadobacter bucti]|uniref:hypothetical protein n=1 Tax=Dyadobacter bucti TaxID=2572203 RepID=UPI003F716E2A